MIALVLLFGLNGCEDNSTKEIKTLRIGILPDQSSRLIEDRYKPLFQYLEKETGIAIELVVPNSYEELVTLFNQQTVDIGYFGGFTFLQVAADSGAIPLVMRDVDARFTSIFFTKADNPAKSIQSLKGSTFSFGSKQSTSGHLMPRHFLKPAFPR